MGDYNPHAPEILGQEWVPIRDEETIFSPWINAVEYGHGFTLTTSRTLQEARVYVDNIPANLASNALGVAIYPRGMEADSGPIRRVVIPVDSLTTTGVGLNTGGAPFTAIPRILYTPEFDSYLSFDTDALRAIAYLSFNMEEYPVLTGKRILAVNLLYAALKSPGTSAVRGSDDVVAIGIQDSTNEFGEIQYSSGEGIPEGSGSFEGIGESGVLRLRFGDRCPFPLVSPRGPWTYPAELGRFDSSSASRLYVTFKTGTDFGVAPADFILYLWYAALEVIFCEERRVIYGIGVNNPVGFGGGSVGTVDYGANIITLMSLPGQATSPVLPAGDYTVTVSGIDDGNRLSLFTAGMRLNALRELYQIPTHPAVQLDIPYPPEDHLDRQLSSIETRILPQISLHASGGTLTEPHAYGRQGKAPVYGAISATQDIYDDLSGVAASYPQVRFYARKFHHTTVPLRLDSTNVTGSGIAVEITPAEHDLLPEIVDGWKECTLRFPTAPSMGAVAGNPAWRFTSVGEQAGSRWEVLSACAPAISGVPGSLLTQATPVHRLGTATYQPPAGDTVKLTWLTPYATGTSADSNCDAVLIFSQDPPAVTGLSISQQTQAITGIGLDCGATPCCIPTGIGYNRLTWGLPVNAGVADDNFDRTEAAGGWGTASDGKTWTVAGVAADFSVTPAATSPTGSATPGEGLITISTTGTNRVAYVDAGGPDQDVTISVEISDAAETGQVRAGAVARLTDTDNFYWAELQQSSTAVQLLISKRVATVETTLVTTTINGLLPSYTTPRTIRLQIKGAYLRAKVWDSDQPEPSWWQAQTTDTDLTTGNNAGVYARDDTTTATSILGFTGFTVRPPDHAFGGYELQRYDQVTATFQTIMLASSPATTGFTDFEARVDVDSVYRIRALNVYQFAGQWSSQVTGAPPAPGVTGAGECADHDGALIFTSNADQTGQHNCAYVMQWTGTPTEQFNLPEAENVAYQPLYNRDGRTAFHGTERGLETFNRTLLIHAGAIDPARLADVRTLRDMAWADLPYVCVRDDVGDRWYANVRIPNVTAQANRTNYLATIDIVETTTEPCIVDPA